MKAVLTIIYILATCTSPSSLDPFAKKTSAIHVDTGVKETINRTNCGPDDLPPPNRVNTSVQVEDLRREMNKKSFSAYIIPSSDEHQTSGGGALRDKRLSFISGYTGSAGIAVVTLDAAVLWTDGRYTIQADQQLDCNWQIIEEYGSGYVTLEQWIASNLVSGDEVGIDPKLVTYTYFLSTEATLSVSEINLIPEQQNLIDLVWGDDQPAEPMNDIVVHNLTFAGVEWEDKIDMLRADIALYGKTMLVVTELDEIAWSMNLRGADIPYRPVFHSYMILTSSALYLHIKSDLTDEVKDHLNVDCKPPDASMCVQIESYHKIFDKIAELSEVYDKTIVPSKANYAIYDAVFDGKSRLLIESPIVYRKAVKNPTEIAGMKRCHIRDSIALSRFLAFLEDEVNKDHLWNELSAEDKLQQFRAEEEHFQGLSFRTISAVGPNGAVIHYRSENSTNRNITRNEMYLLDSGGQYLDCTTDITRTMHYGTPTDFQKEAYTRVLMGAIEYASLVFPDNKYSAVDAFARHNLWRYGLDYKHGTSHGVGAYLYLSENISPALYPQTQPGLFMSDEPGYYETGVFGVRLETIITTVYADTMYLFDGVPYITFEPATFVPFEPKLMKLSLLNQNHISWLNNYNELCRKHTGSELFGRGDTLAYNWLMERTEPIADLCDSSSSKISFSFALILSLLVLFVGADFKIV